MSNGHAYDPAAGHDEPVYDEPVYGGGQQDGHGQAAYDVYGRQSYGQEPYGQPSHGQSWSPEPWSAQSSYPQPTEGWGTGEYDADATGFVQLPAGGLPGADPFAAPGATAEHYGDPLAAPGTGQGAYTPPSLSGGSAPMTPSASTDPAAAGQWTMPFAPEATVAPAAPAAPEPPETAAGDVPAGTGPGLGGGFGAGMLSAGRDAFTGASGEQAGHAPESEPDPSEPDPSEQQSGQGAAAALAGSHEARTRRPLGTGGGDRPGDQDRVYPEPQPYTSALSDFEPQSRPHEHLPSPPYGPDHGAPAFPGSPGFPGEATGEVPATEGQSGPGDADAGALPAEALTAGTPPAAGLPPQEPDGGPRPVDEAPVETTLAIPTVPDGPDGRNLPPSDRAAQEQELHEQELRERALPEQVPEQPVPGPVPQEPVAAAPTMQQEGPEPGIRPTEEAAAGGGPVQPFSEGDTHTGEMPAPAGDVPASDPAGHAATNGRAATTDDALHSGEATAAEERDAGEQPAADAMPPDAAPVDVPPVDVSLPAAMPAHVPPDEAAAEGVSVEPPAPAVDTEHPHTSYFLHVNGVDRPVTDAWIGESLLYVLRERLGLAGAKDGCSQGECGACSVQVDGRLVASCLVPAATAAGSEIRTVEGLAVDGAQSDVQQALADSGAVQCGFCVPGMAMAVHDLLEGNHRPTELQVRQAICGNLCRCSGYRGVLDAVRSVADARSERADDRTGTDRAPGAADGHGADGHGADGRGADGRVPVQAGPGERPEAAAGTADSSNVPRIPHQAGPRGSGEQAQGPEGGTP